MTTDPDPTDHHRADPGRADRPDPHADRTAATDPGGGPPSAATAAVPAVLLLCVHNAGRSQMAAGWLRHLAGDRVEVFSGGSSPGSAINPMAMAAMAEVGIDISAEQPKPWTDEMARTAAVIVSMGCGDACPVYPGTRYEDWPLTDPAGQPIETVRVVRDQIRARVEDLIADLGLTPA
ncbi:MAG: arsenate reductase ArsC [Acidimicrobiales bacterium]